MKRDLITITIAIIFLISSVIFAIKQEWVFAVIFILIGIIYILKTFKRGKSNDEHSSK
ncbi:TPA: hypothetical protein I1462_000524 [Staphylococcus pseudintermedius]|uniref:DUF308 domain-containing protein n=1 Tax=Staphylococcus pseudintermedius TaxID=283734 RepID=A0A317YW77_STAPS|nr:hypothetical protein D8L98_01970 [Staphylococcus pseudintermedius]EGQ0289244.1 hypothetical protein [Staphylococcus pseudintermedius]EGQ0298619.1 hypothetical protein [Staphylococcus pseudintermedius]EGQ0305952.1 hypothetical protein [Staphylococcus pseudintermedius]EGQ0310205.1 hypothetical protein [Staphylococcus pseudintermedius]